MAKILEFPKKVTVVSQNSVELNSQNNFLESSLPKDNTVENILDVTNYLRDQGSQDRRKAQRVIFSHLIASHVVLPQMGLAQVIIRDVDEGGLAFEMDSFFGKFSKGDSLELRFYLNGQTYFRVDVEVAYSSIDEEAGVSRHGTRFLQGSYNQEALFHFVQFLKLVSISLRTDRGERTVSNLTS